MRTLLIIIFSVLVTAARLVTLVSGVIAFGLLFSGKDGAEVSGVICIGACLVIIMSNSILETLQGR